MDDLEKKLLGIIDDFNFTEGKEKLSLIEQAYLKKYASLWALKYKAIKNRPTVFASKHNVYAMRKWQVQILDDPHDNIVIQKSRQLGLSETGMTKVLHFLANNNNTKAVYTFPRDQQMKEFSNTRIAPALQTGEYMQNLVSKEQNSMSLKKIGSSYLFMRSAWGSALGEGVDAGATRL